MSAAKPPPPVLLGVSTEKNGTVCVHFWSSYEPGGIGANAYLTEEVAEDLIARLRKAIDSRPRVATAADLGLAA